MLSETSLFLKEIKNNFYWDNQFLADILKLTKPEFEQKLLYQNYTFRDLERISDFFQINIEDVVSGNVDYKLLKNKFYSPQASIPHEYTINAGTYMSNIRAMVNHIRNKTNQKCADHILNKFGIAKEALINDSLLVNLKLANNVLSHMEDVYGLNQIDYISICALSYESSMRKKLLEFNGNHNSIKEVARFIISNVVQYEKNFNYKLIDLPNNQFIFRGCSKPNAEELFKDDLISTQPATEFRKVSIQMLTILMNYPCMNIFNTSVYKKQGSEYIDFYIQDKSLSRLIQ